MESIITNGLNSIRVGMEDYEQARKNGSEARLTSAVRNVYAGILILAKAKLYELSPPDSAGILIRVVRPELVDRRIELVPDKRKTIGYEEIKRRFEHFRLKLDWAKIERVGAIRNDLEHFYHRGARSNVQEALADAATAIRGLLVHLNLDPVRNLGQPWWGILLRNEELFAAERAACHQTFANVHWLNETARAASAHFVCQECKSPLIRQADAGNGTQDAMRLSCAACGAGTEVRAAMERAVTEQYGRELYEAQTQGGELPVVRCPECRNYALVLDTNECAACGSTLGAQTTWCDTCRNPLSAEESRNNSHECPAFFKN